MITYAAIKPENSSTLYEHQILASAVFSFPVAKNWTIVDRNMYFHRFRKDLTDLSFYRNRLGLNHKTQLLKKELNVYLYDEVFLSLENDTLKNNALTLESKKKEIYNSYLLAIYALQRKELFQLRKEKFFSDEEIRSAELQLDLKELKTTGLE